MDPNTRTVRVFIASPFFDKEQLERIQRLENALTRNPYVSEFYSARFHQNQQYPWGSKGWRKVVFNLDLYYLRRADVVVAIHITKDYVLTAERHSNLAMPLPFKNRSSLLKKKQVCQILC
ncbi:nucleoside 2-deoxyribosyltransferase [Fictibacillus sp. WQ 8-8]|uniref:nucleoside 2-deoxyribosyltransferase n=1 Tax=Fictibacillus sp. WQ 8-8 TaxID=2938788 RepID=UPI00210E763D|nr:nucleoside 2-deoxyribosyltransferase [Fictibacillus sp. WQ 8-8]MCQ6266736.1 nucleoside 2-deoxyribosyltransferase [Fictibacillus sp. WQ 8-8]